MRKFKVFMALLLCIALVFSITACSKVKEKAEQKLIEKAIEKGTGSEATVTNDGVKLEGKDGSFETGENLKWPKDAMGDLPELNANITGVIKGGTAVNVTFKDLSKSDAEQYVKKIEGLGYKSAMNFSDDKSMMFGATKDDKFNVTFMYNNETKEGSISYEVK